MKKNIQKNHFILNRTVRFALLLLISFLLSVSCKNFFEDSISSDEDVKTEITEISKPVTTPVQERRTHVEFSGSLEYNNRGASSSELNNIIESTTTTASTTNAEQTPADNSERSASVSVPNVTANSDCQYEYYIKATPDSGQAREVIANLVDGVWSYNISLEIGKTWTFEAGLRKKAQGTFGEADYVEAKTILLDVQSDSGHPFSKTLTEETASVEKPFILKPRQNGGYGKINLEMKKVPDTVSRMTIKINDSNGVEQTSLLDKLEYGFDSSDDAGNFIKSKTEGNNEYTFPSGTYDFIISFCQAYGTAPNIVYFPIYTTIQTVAVFDNMSTDVWKNGNPSAANSIVDSTGKFELTSAIIQNYVTSTLYVGKFSDAASAASDSNSGFPFEPLETLTGAFNKIIANQVVQGSGKCDYRIILCENQTGNFEIPATILTSKVSTIDISGYNNTQKVLNGGNSGTVLTISSTVPVTISHLQITGGNAENGGGIYMASSTKLTLGEGALVGRDVQALAGSGNSDHGNYASVRGGGIYVHNATLILKNGSKVCNNYVNSSAGVHASGGGGISLYGGSLTIENGAVISWNNSANGRGGGILVPDPNDDESNASVLTMKGGEISHNTAGWYGGGVMLGHTGTVLGRNYTAKTFNFLGGTISENSISQRATSAPLSGGAGIFLDGGTFTMSGNAVIEKNVAILSDGQTGGGGIAISDSAEATGSFTMTGGIIRNNSASKGGALYFDDSGTGTEKSYSISGSASIPYGVNGTKAIGKNDVYIGKTGSLNIAAALSDSFPELGISNTDQQWKRGQTVMKLADGVSLSEELVGKFNCLVPSDDWEKIISTDKVSVNCPFYVGSYNGTAGSDSNAGTKVSPYATIEKACQQMTDKDTDYIIKIIGSTAAERQKIPADLKKDGSGTYNAKSVKLLGVDSSAVINRGLSTATSGSDDGTALLIESPVPVFLSNLKITGGFSSTSGGGIQLNSDTELHIESGAVIESNKAASGAGIHINKGTLYITGGEIKKNSTTLADDTNGGGIYNFNGNLYITGGKISENNAQLGGAIFVYAGDDNTKISGTATIEKGSGTAESPLNDICVWAGKLNIPSDITNHDTTSSKQIALRVRETKEKGSQIIAGDGVASAYQKFDLIPSGYKFDSDGKLQLKNIITSIYVKQGTAQNPVTDPSGNTKNGSTWNNYNYSYNASTSNQSKPFATIEKALQFITYQESAADYTIYLTGNFTQTSVALTKDNSDSNNPIKLIKTPASGQVATATSLTITGASALSSGAPQDIVNSYVNSSTYNTTFNITTDVPVTFKKLHIQGGYAVDSSNPNGGGIKIASGADVTLDEYTFVHDNYAKCGAGIFNEGKLTVKTNTKIYGNTRDKTGGSLTLGGGGIYNNGANAKVYIEGGEIYSNSAANNSANGGGIYNGGGSVFIYGAANLGTQDCTNAASNGGAIYNAGYLYLGYKSAGTGAGKPPVNTTDSWTGKIQYNMASKGAGIYNAADSYVYMKAGEISNNVQQGSSTAENVQGLGVWNAGYFQMSSGYIQNHKNNTRYGTGAGVFINKNGTFEMAGGYIKENYIVQRSGSYKGKGGAVYNKGRFIIRGGASIPYGATINDTFIKEAGCNDVFLADQTDESTEGSDLKPAGQTVITVGNVSASSAATITLPDYKRGKVVLTALTSGNGSITDLTNYISKVTVIQPESDSEWKNEVYTDKTKAYLNAPIYVKGSGGASTNDGASLSKAVTSLANAEAIITTANVPALKYEIIVSGALSVQSFTDGINNKAAGITLRGNSTDRTNMDKIRGASTTGENAIALKIKTSVPITIKNLEIRGAVNTAQSDSQGGGINIIAGATVTLSDGTIVQNNEAQRGAGIYNAGTLTITGSGSSDDKRCIIKNSEVLYPRNKTKWGAGVYNKGTLNIEGYAKFVDNGCTMLNPNAGGAIHNVGTLNMKGNFEFPAGNSDSTRNDIYLAEGHPITITGAINGNGTDPVAKLSVPSAATNGFVLLQRGDGVSATNFTNAVAKFEMLAAKTIETNSDTDKGILVNGIPVTDLYNTTTMQNAINKLTKDGDSIVLKLPNQITGFSTNVVTIMNNSSYKFHLDLSLAVGDSGGIHYASNLLTGFSKVSELSIKVEAVRRAPVINNFENLEKIYFYGSTNSETHYSFGSLNIITACPKLQEIIFVDAQSVYIGGGLLNRTTSGTTYTGSPSVIIRIPESCETIYIADFFASLSSSNVKIVYEGSSSSLTMPGKVLRHTSSTWDAVTEGIKIYYDGSTDNYKTWTPDNNAATGTWN